MHLKDDEDEKESCKKIKLPITLFISEGDKYLRLLKFEKAISSFEKVLERDSNHIRALLGRAKCYMRLAKYEEAWHDFQQVIQLNPKCTEAVYLKGVAEYLRGDFEKSFTTYWEGYKLRPARDELRKGYEMCKKAVDNSLNADIPLWITGKDVSKMCMLLKSKDTSSELKIDIRGTYDAISVFTADLKLLEDILKDKNLTSIHSLCKDLFDYLTVRQKFWKMQSPQIINKRTSFRTLKNDIYDLLVIKRLIQNFGICKASAKGGKTRICRKRGQEVLEALTGVSYEYFPGKIEMETETLQYLGLASFKEGDISSALKYYQELLVIASKNNMPDIEGRTLQSMGEIYYKNHKFEKAASCFQRSQELVMSESNEAIILYKISDCNIHLNNLDQAKTTARKCLEFTIKNQDCRFQLDVLLLLAEIAVKGKEMKIAEQYFSEALELAIQSHDTRQKDLRGLMRIFDEISGKECYSDERIKIVKITQDIKHPSVPGNV